jgi:hypothetical protein
MMSRRKGEIKPVTLEDDTGKIIPFKILEGGRLGYKQQPPYEGDWLSPMPIGTYFLAGDKRSADPFLEQFYITDKTETSVNLEIDLIDKRIHRWVIPERFCQQRFLHEILGILRDE